ncbi:unnamed protein product [Strongylus vulgaris]|uniref:Amidinotransferase n=1 Tax=Strongylus vulgaris TaxID=40348 RepID=A0A3P7JG16_STRVU|nr:unnamed protein product [Strongylus vulgaris]
MASATAPLKEVVTAAKRILMCRPTYFQLSYSINPWMDMRRGVNRPKAMEQWETLKRTLEDCGAQVEVMEADGAESYPDMVFSANAAVIKGNRAYLANFTHPERKGERYKIHFPKSCLRLIIHIHFDIANFCDATKRLL